MESILGKFKNMNSDDWDYYFGAPLNNPFYFIENGNFDVFITDYFGNSGKREMVHDFRKIALFTPSRAIHTVSVFFLGILIWKKTNLKEIFLSNETNIRGNPTFQFIWFLSILFHDYAESIEERLDYNDLDDLFKKYKIEYRLTDLKQVEHIDKTLFRLIKKYYYYRRYSMKSIDHGILAGIYMYDRLIKIRRKKEEEEKLENGKGLHWKVSLEKHYATAAGAIACHNIWTKKNTLKSIVIILSLNWKHWLDLNLKK